MSGQSRTKLPGVCGHFGGTTEISFQSSYHELPGVFCCSRGMTDVGIQSSNQESPAIPKEWPKPVSSRVTRSLLPFQRNDRSQSSIELPEVSCRSRGMTEASLQSSYQESPAVSGSAHLRGKPAEDRHGVCQVISHSTEVIHFDYGNAHNYKQIVKQPFR